MLLLVKRYKNPSFLQTLEAGIHQVFLFLIYVTQVTYGSHFYLSGIIMSLHLYHRSQTRPSTSAVQDRRLCILCAYEDGSVVLREYQNSKETSVEGVGWSIVWKSKLHVESSRQLHAFLTVFLY